MKYGIERLCADLADLGYEPERVTASDGSEFAVIRRFLIELGLFAGRIIDLGIPAPPNFPISAGAAIHVRAEPQLFECSDSVANVRNVTTSVLGPEWRYWSKNFGWSSEQSTRRLMAQINSIFANA